MKPPAFHYAAPRTLEEALETLRRHAGDAKVLAGGQSLVPLLNFRLAQPAVLVDLNGVPGLEGIHWDPDTSELVLGAMVRQADAERSRVVTQASPLFVEALAHVGHRAIRNRGTIGGSLAHADPAAELPLLLVLLDGRVRVRSAGRERWLSASELFVSYLATALQPDEILLEARYRVTPGAPWGFQEFSRRAGDFALAAAAVALRLNPGGVIEKAAVAVAGGGPTPLRLGDRTGADGTSSVRPSVRRRLAPRCGGMRSRGRHPRLC